MILVKALNSPVIVQAPQLLIILVLLKSFISDASAQSSEICGSVTTSAGTKVYLRENVTLSAEDFEKIHVGKLKGAVFNFEIENQECVIEVCGFKSFQRPYVPDLIGSSEDYADCRLIKNNNTYAIPEIFDENYNVSSISCACWKFHPGCTYSCEEKRLHMKPDLKENECALLYQEEACHNCYFNAVTLKTDQNFSTDFSHHVRTLYVRDDCVVRLDIPAFKYMYRFWNATLPLNFTKDKGSSNVMSAFQSEPETFYCECGIPDETPTSSTPTPTTPLLESSTKSAEDEDNEYFIAVVALGVTTCLSLFTLGFIGKKVWDVRRGSGKLPPYLPWFSEKASNRSYYTDTTRVASSFGSGPLDYSRIVESPFNEAYDTHCELFEIGKKLNQGNHGEIFEATLKVAVKVIRRANDEESFRALHQEAKFLSRIGTHPNVVRLLGVYSDNFINGELVLLVEFCQNGSLKSYLKDVTEPHVKSIVRRRVSDDVASSAGSYAPKKVLETLDEETKYYDLEDLDPALLRQMYLWCEQISNGMEYISAAMKVIHGDLSARNILLNHKLVAKIADFGLARKSYLKTSEVPADYPSEMPVRWLAPEVLCKHEDCTVESDIWSFGIVVWEIFTLGEYLPYHDYCSWTQIINAAQRSEKPGQIIGCVTPTLYEKLSECWDENPKHRPSFSELREYFAEKKNAMDGSECAASDHADASSV